jgi:drug/metabolite transporter (DMT)-like permease
LVTHPFFSRSQVVMAVACLCCLLWGSAYPAIKNGYALFAIAADDIASRMVFAGYRFVIAGVLLLIMALATRRQIFDLNWKKLREITTLGLTQTSLQYGFLHWPGLHHRGQRVHHGCHRHLFQRAAGAFHLSQ